MTRRLLPKLGFRDEHLRCWECPRTLGCSRLEVGPVQRCWLGFEGYQASRKFLQRRLLFPHPRTPAHTVLAPCPAFCSESVGPPRPGQPGCPELQVSQSRAAEEACGEALPTTSLEHWDAICIFSRFAFRVSEVGEQRLHPPRLWNVYPSPTGLTTLILGMAGPCHRSTPGAQFPPLPPFS